MIKSKLPLGQLLLTPGATEALQKSGQEPMFFVLKHASGDWGTVNEDDWAANDAALWAGDRVISAYTTLKGAKLWVITEADRSATTILLPEEY